MGRVRVGWLHDFRLEDRPGGAQLTNAGVIAAAPPALFDVVPMYPGHVGKADVYVLNNVKFFSPDELERAMRKPFVKFEHDHWDTPNGWQQEWIGRVYGAALGVIFLSPLHAQSFMQTHKVEVKRMALVPSAVDPTQFGPPEAEREFACWLGEFQPHKGMQAAVEWAREHGPVDFYGFGPCPPEDGPNVRNCGYLEYSRVPEMLRRYERFVFLPPQVEPFGRTVAEAVLSGCKLVVNGNVGAISWGWKTGQEWREGVGTAGARFWRVVEGWL